MAHVASCPQCKHDLLVPDDTDQESWAKCPECRAFFQVSQAALRELPAILPVEPPSQDLHAAAVSAALADTNMELESPQPGDNLQAAAERIDEWFRSAKTVPDSPPMADSGTPDAPADIGQDADQPLAPWPNEPQSSATFDDSQHMDKLLADIQTPPPEPRAVDETPTPLMADGNYGKTIAATDVADLPVFAKPAKGQGRRKRSLLRTLTAVVVAGVVGSALGYYALLWIRGPSGDFLNVAQYLPPAILPAELQAKPKPLPPAAPLAAEVPTENADVATATPAEGPAESAEVQATFTTTDEPVAPKSQPVDDRYGIETIASQPANEPAPLDEPPAAPVVDDTAVAETAGVADAPTFTADELAAALEAAQDAQPSLVAGDLNDGRDMQRAKGYSYSLLADLAQKATFADAATNAESIAASQQAAEELFRATLSDAHTRGEVAVIVPKWLASPNRKHGGVFFAASLTNPTGTGAVTECSAALDSGQSLTLLVPTALTDQLADSSRPLGVVGWIVDRPRELVAGYTGQAQQAVWVSRIIPLE